MKQYIVVVHLKDHYHEHHCILKTVQLINVLIVTVRVVTIYNTANDAWTLQQQFLTI